jgi:hypothetical protein
MMKFRALSESLHDTAKGAARYFSEERGLRSIAVEIAIDAFPEYVFTLSGTTTEYVDVCIEVSEAPYPSILENVVLDGKSRCVPISLYSAFPERRSPPANYKERVDRARMHGVGVVEITPNGARLIHEAIPLHLHGARLEIKRFPKRFRVTLTEADSVFRAGSPAKACSIIYDEIEAISRNLAQRTYQKGFWKNPPPKPRFTSAPWARVMDQLGQQLDYGRCRGVSRALLARILGITEHRNESGHKPRNRVAKVKRDQELRTRFEAAADLLFDVVSAKV